MIPFASVFRHPLSWELQHHTFENQTFVESESLQDNHRAKVLTLAPRSIRIRFRKDQCRQVWGANV